MNEKVNTCIYFVNKTDFVMRVGNSYQLFHFVGLQTIADTNTMRIVK